MENNENWLKDVQEEIERATEDIYPRDYKFYQIDRFVHLAELINVESQYCRECAHLKTDFSEISSSLPLFFEGSVKMRKKFEKEFYRMLKHMRLEHGYYPKDYFISVYSFWGLILGLIISISVYFFVRLNVIYTLSAGAMLGVFVARQFGKVKDKKLQSEKRIL